MKAFIQYTGIVAPLDRPNVDTDAIIPKQFLKSIKRTGFGPNVFDDWRYLDAGGLDIDNRTRRVNPDFILNQPPFDKAGILLARENFGCGSSREHAVWALDDFGFRAVIASGFADIFYNNSFKNGLLPIVLSVDTIDDLFTRVAQKPGLTLSVDLEKQQVSCEGKLLSDFDIDSFRKYCLLNGLDDIDLTLQHGDEIKAYEEKRKRTAPWLF